MRTRAQEAGGFTLVELLVAMVAAVTVLGAAFAMLESSQRVQARDSEWALTLQEDRAGLARMMRDMRQATEVKESKPGAVFFLELIEGKEWEVKYQCTVTQSGTTYTECVRLAAEKGKGLPATGPRIAKDVLNGTQVFSYSPSSESSKVRAATARIELPASGTLKQAGSSGYTHKVVLEDAAFMRTVYPEG